MFGVKFKFELCAIAFASFFISISSVSQPGCRVRPRDQRWPGLDPETNSYGIRNVGIKDGKNTAITEKKIDGKQAIIAAQVRYWSR